MKKKIEAWFRRLIASEVAWIGESFNSIETSLKTERDVLSAHAQIVFENLEADSCKLLRELHDKLAAEAAFVIAEKDRQLAAAHRDVAEAHEKLAKLSHWKADSQTVAADDSLKLVK